MQFGDLIIDEEPAADYLGKFNTGEHTSNPVSYSAAFLVVRICIPPGLQSWKEQMQQDQELFSLKIGNTALVKRECCLSINLQGPLFSQSKPVTL